MKLNKILTAIVIVLSIIGAVLWLFVLAVPTELIESLLQAIKRGETVEIPGSIAGMIDFAQALTYIVAAVAVVFSLINVFSDPKKIKGAVIAIVGLLVVAGIGYGLASGVDVDDKTAARATESTIKNVGAGLNVFYILAAVAVGAMIFSGVKKAIK